MKLRESEYLIDRLNENIAALEDRVKTLVHENKVLHEECKFGAIVAMMFGLAVGIVTGTVIAWQS